MTDDMTLGELGRRLAVLEVQMSNMRNEITQSVVSLKSDIQTQGFVRQDLYNRDQEHYIREQIDQNKALERLERVQWWIIAVLLTTSAAGGIFGLLRVTNP